MTKPLTPEVRAYIERRLDAGTGPRAIARGLGIHRTTVQRINRARKASKPLYKIDWVTGPPVHLQDYRRPIFAPNPVLTNARSRLLEQPMSAPTPGPMRNALKAATIGVALGLAVYAASIALAL